MTLLLEDQYRLAVMQDGFRSRVTAAAFMAAASMVTAAANSDATKQSQRMALANKIIHKPDSATDQFAWAVVTRPSLTQESDITDIFITTTVNTTFDIIASLLT
jgi:hypothetical protein